MNKTGLPPGVSCFVGTRKMDEILLRRVDYDFDTFCEDKNFTEAEENLVSWMHVVGLHDVAEIERICKELQVPNLVIEDILHTGQRPKVDSLQEMLFMIARVPSVDKDSKRIHLEQVSFLLSGSNVLSFQEAEPDLFLPILERLKKKTGKIRKAGADYLFYCLLDISIDHFFEALSQTQDYLEEIDNVLENDPSQEILTLLFQLKKDLKRIKRQLQPWKDIFLKRRRDWQHHFHDSQDPFLGDVEDHIHQGLSQIDGQLDHLTSMVEFYHSQVSFKTNEIMKVLTMIATIFIPLSFIAGLYGMNFDYIPELKMPYGYFYCLALMAIVTGGILYFFKRKNWI